MVCYNLLLEYIPAGFYLERWPSLVVYIHELGLNEPKREKSRRRENRMSNEVDIGAVSCSQDINDKGRVFKRNSI
jgi:hypothetical protein